MSSYSARELVRQSERAHGFNTALGSQPWAARGSTGPRAQPQRRTRLPTPVMPPASQINAVAAAQAGAQTAASLAAEEPPTPTTTPTPTPATATTTNYQTQADEDDDGYGTEPYEAVHDDEPELQYGEPSDTQRLLELEQEVAQLRLANHHLEGELARLRRLRNQERQLNQLATGPYWISRTRR